MQDFTLGTCQAMTFEEWALSQLLMICRPDGYLDQTKDGIHSTYLVEKVRALVLAGPRRRTPVPTGCCPA
jgi:hypothetical protein